MKLVIALATGHDGTQVRQEGEQFYVDESRLEDGSTWFKPVEVEEKTDGGSSSNPFLDRKADDIKADIPALTDSELVEYRAAEDAGKTRKSVIEAIDAEIAARAAK